MLKFKASLTHFPKFLAELIGRLRQHSRYEVDKGISLCPIDGIAPRTIKQRHALERLLYGPAAGCILSSVTGYKRGRRVITQLRKLGLEIPCTLSSYTYYRKKSRVGLYRLTEEDRLKVLAWKHAASVSDNSVGVKR